MLDGGALEEHVLNRLGYGQSDWHRSRYRELGFDRYVTEQLSGSLSRLSSQSAKISSKLAQAVLERRQLEAMLFDFWFNHFNVDASGNFVKKVIGSYLNDVIRPAVLGRFGDLLVATAQSPAMLDYLDNRSNFVEGTFNGKEFGPNENYARELMELHTLGIGGGYSENDVIEVARVMTGWSTGQSRQYVFQGRRHDAGAKTVMGVRYPAGRAEDEGVELLGQLAQHPSTATHIGTKLCRRLVSEDPSATVVRAAADTFRSTGGDLAAVVRAIVESPDFLAERNFRAKVKPPLRFLASAVQAMGATSARHYAGVEPALVDGVENLGEEPFRVGAPTGYPEASPFWVSSSSMLGRFQVAGAVAADGRLRNRLKATAGTDGSSVTDTVDAVAARLCPGGISASTRAAVVGYVQDHAGSDNQRVTDAAHLILSSPEFVRF